MDLIDNDLYSMYSEPNEIRRHNSNMFSRAVLSNKRNYIFDDNGKCVEFKQCNRFISLTVNGDKKIYDIFTILNSGLEIKIKKPTIWGKVKNLMRASR